MLKEKKPNRRLVLLVAVIVELCLGVVLAWPVYAEKLCERAGRYGFTASQINWIFILSVVSFTVSVFIAGRLMDRAGARKLLLAGGATCGLGYLLGGLFGETFLAQLVFVGILGGAGAGFAYLVPPALIVRWFPDIKGTALGITLAGFGFGIVFWSSLAKGLSAIDIMGLGGLQSIYLLYGLIIFFSIAAGSLILTDSPWDFMPPGSGMGGATSGLVNFEPGEMIRDRQFYLLIIIFFLTTLALMSVMEAIGAYGAHALKAKGLEMKIALKVAQLATFISQCMIGAGCVIWGALSDRIERKLILSLMCLFQGVVVFLLYHMAGSPQSLIFFSCFAGLGVGATFVLFLALTGDYFGDRNLGVNYAWVFPAAGLAAAIAPQVAFHILDAAKGGQDPSPWTILFMGAGAASLISGLIALMLKVPRKVS